jgi:hypothetical protein
MLTMRIKKLIVGVAVLAAPAFAMAQSAEQLIQKYTPLVGQANVQALVNGLRDGTKITMSSTTWPSEFCRPAPTGGIIPIGGPLIPVGFTVEFIPPTGTMGYGNVDNALTLVQGSLANIDIVTDVTDTTKQRAVTAADVCAALVGGVVTPKAGAAIALPGILKLRSEGLGWGEISKHPDIGAKL